MPAKDAYHDVVVNALKKDGWTSIQEQLPISIATRTIWVDIKAEKPSSSEIIVVEIKGFENLSSPVSYLGNVVGQYVVYRAVLEHKQIKYPLYLAVPHIAYSNFLREEIAQVIINRLDIKLLVFDTSLEEIVLWQI